MIDVIDLNILGLCAFFGMARNSKKPGAWYCGVLVLTLNLIFNIYERGAI